MCRHTEGIKQLFKRKSNPVKKKIINFIIFNQDVNNGVQIGIWPFIRGRKLLNPIIWLDIRFNYISIEPKKNKQLRQSWVDSSAP
jgi:hypothetical protein